MTVNYAGSLNYSTAIGPYFHWNAMSELLNTTIRVKGARYYEAQAALDAGELEAGCSIKLKPEPNNKHDGNAVAVYTHKNRMLGHLARDIAEKYQKLCFDNRIESARVVSAKETDDFSKFDIRISIASLRNASDKSSGSKADTIDKTITEGAGIYEVSFGADRVYIGASGNLRQRKRSHLADLVRNAHTNKLIQKDFNAFGESAFRFRVIKLAHDLQEAERYESEEINQRLLRGDNLYNKTADGKGIRVSSPTGQNSISDVYQRGLRSNSKVESRSSTSSPKIEPENVRRKLGSERVEKETQSSPVYVQGAKLLIDDAEYEGEIVDGKAHGKGRITWRNGDSYFGQFDMNKRTGKGVFYWKNGKSYEGDFVNGEITGNGKFRWTNGDQLEGEFLKGRRLSGAKFTRGLKR